MQRHPIEIKFDGEVQSIKSGQGHTLFLSNGKIFGLGRACQGRLGKMASEEFNNVLKEINVFNHAKAIECGTDYSVALV